VNQQNGKLLQRPSIVNNRKPTVQKQVSEDRITPANRDAHRHQGESKAVKNSGSAVFLISQQRADGSVMKSTQTHNNSKSSQRKRPLSTTSGSRREKGRQAKSNSGQTKNENTMHNVHYPVDHAEKKQGKQKPTAGKPRVNTQCITNIINNQRMTEKKQGNKGQRQAN
jgi:hypothetical protein